MYNIHWVLCQSSNGLCLSHMFCWSVHCACKCMLDFPGKYWKRVAGSGWHQLPSTLHHSSACPILWKPFYHSWDFCIRSKRFPCKSWNSIHWIKCECGTRWLHNSSNSWAPQYNLKHTFDVTTTNRQTDTSAILLIIQRPVCAFTLCCKGGLYSPKWMNFRKNPEGGEGEHFRSKEMVVSGRKYR